MHESETDGTERRNRSTIIVGSLSIIYRTSWQKKSVII